ncbi:MAG: hypothetical protein WD267_05770 [Balneolales bacterium]
MKSLPRAFSYTSVTLLIGVVIYMFTQNLIQFINQPGLQGIIFSIGFLLFYTNVNYLMSRRFVGKTIDLENFPYLMAILLIIPALVLSELTQQFYMPSHQVMFVLIILMGSLLGATLGIKKGLIIRKESFRESMQQPEIPEDLRRAKEKLSNN